MLGKYAFANCTSLEKLCISGETTISDGTFYGCSKLKELMIPRGLYTSFAGKYAFAYCTSLEKIVIENKRITAVSIINTSNKSDKMADKRCFVMMPKPSAALIRELKESKNQ